MPIRCPYCGEKSHGVLDTRKSGEEIRRRRVCPNGHRFTTYETVAREIKSGEAS